MDYINTIGSESDWAIGRNNGNIIDNSLTLILSDEEMKFSREIDTIDYPVGTIVFVDNIGNKYFIEPNNNLNNFQEEIRKKLHDEACTPIGIIVVPASHAPNGIARMASIAINTLTLDYENVLIESDNLKTYNHTMVIGTDDDLEQNTLPPSQT
jgi:hypothetical protein